MPVYECSVSTCPNQYVDGTPRKRLYCTAHNALEPKPDFDPEKKVIIHLTEEQTADLREILKEHGDPKLAFRPVMPPVVSPDQVKLRIAIEALHKIRNRLPSSWSSSIWSIRIGTIVTDTLVEMAKL